jgi:hypothetical protein
MGSRIARILGNGRAAGEIRQVFPIAEKLEFDFGGRPLWLKRALLTFMGSAVTARSRLRASLPYNW